MKAATVVSSLKKWAKVPVEGEVTEKAKGFVAVVFTLLVMSFVVRLQGLEKPGWPGLDQESLDDLFSILEALGTLDEMITEEKLTRASQQDLQEAKINEPAQKRLEAVPREDEPGSTQEATHKKPEEIRILGNIVPKQDDILRTYKV